MVEGNSHVAMQSSGTTAATAKADTPGPLHLYHHPKADYFYEDMSQFYTCMFKWVAKAKTLKMC